MTSYRIHTPKWYLRTKGRQLRKSEKALRKGQRPPGSGWQPIPNGKKGGFRKKGPNGKWQHWYPDSRGGKAQQLSLFGAPPPKSKPEPPKGPNEDAATHRERVKALAKVRDAIANAGQRVPASDGNLAGIVKLRSEIHGLRREREALRRKIPSRIQGPVTENPEWAAVKAWDDGPRGRRYREVKKELEAAEKQHGKAAKARAVKVEEIRAPLREKAERLTREAERANAARAVAKDPEKFALIPELGPDARLGEGYIGNDAGAADDLMRTARALAAKGGGFRSEKQARFLLSRFKGRNPAVIAWARTQGVDATARGRVAVYTSKMLTQYGRADVSKRRYAGMLLVMDGGGLVLAGKPKFDTSGAIRLDQPVETIFRRTEAPEINVDLEAEIEAARAANKPDIDALESFLRRNPPPPRTAAEAEAAGYVSTGDWATEKLPGIAADFLDQVMRGRPLTPKQQALMLKHGIYGEEAKATKVRDLKAAAPKLAEDFTMLVTRTAELDAELSLAIDLARGQGSARYDAELAEIRDAVATEGSHHALDTAASALLDGARARGPNLPAGNYLAEMRAQAARAAKGSKLTAKATAHLGAMEATLKKYADASDKQILETLAGKEDLSREIETVLTRRKARKSILAVPLRKSGGWQPIPGGKKGGRRRRKGSGWEYDYGDKGGPPSDPKKLPSITPPKAMFGRDSGTIKILGVIPASDGDVRIETDGLGIAKMPKASARHFVNDLSGVVKEPKSGDRLVDAVIDGKAKFLGKGDDGLAFKLGTSVVKVSTTVPYQPSNPGHRTPQQAKAMLRKQVEIGNAMADAGIPALRSRFVESGEKGFQVKPYVTIPEKWTKPQLEAIRAGVEKMHAAGYTMNDEIQAGITAGGDVVFYDTGKAAKGGSAQQKEDDLSGVKQLFRSSGVAWQATSAADIYSELDDIAYTLTMKDPSPEEEKELRAKFSKLSARYLIQTKQEGKTLKDATDMLDFLGVDAP